MATGTGTETAGGTAARAWLTGAVGGLAGALVTGLVIQFAFDQTIISASIPAAVGASGLVAGWAVLLAIGAGVGLVYAGLARVDPLAEWAVRPNTGAALGLAFGLVLWVVAVVVVPLVVGGSIGAYALTTRAVLSYALLGVLLGLVYGVSPYTRR